MLDKFYEICKFIVCLCGTILIVLFTVASIYIALKQGGRKMKDEEIKELAEKDWQVYKTYMNAIVGDKITKEVKRYLELGFKAGYLEGFKKCEGD